MPSTIRNPYPVPFTLPEPYGRVIPPGGSVVVSDSPADFETLVPNSGLIVTVAESSAEALTKRMTGLEGYAAAKAYADSAVVLDADFTLQTVGQGLFVRASVGTAQRDATVLSYAVDAPRFGRYDSSHDYGLIIEPVRTNLIANSRDTTATGWTAGNGTRSTGYAGPDGALSAERWILASGQFSHYWVSAQAANPFVFSLWRRRGSAAALVQFVGWTNSGSNYQAIATAADPWNRYVAIPSTHTAGDITLTPVDGANRVAGGGIAAGARDAVVDMNQVEVGKYATEFIQTSGGTAQRKGEKLSFDTGRCVAGRLSIYLKFRPKSTAANADGVQRFWTQGSDYAEIETNGTVTVSIAGQTNTFSMSYSALDVVEVFMAVGGNAPSVIVYRVNAGSNTYPAITGSALGMLLPTDTFHAYSDGAATPIKQLAGWHYRLTCYGPGGRPSWV